MKVLVVGSGGREHALAWKIAQSPLLTKLYAAPGNPGILELAECVNIQASDIPGLLNFAKTQKIDLTVVGPEAPLVAGLADAFRAEGLLVFGPSRRAAELEGSKIFSKRKMAEYKIPTAAFEVAEDLATARKTVESWTGLPIVIKADGLAAGKGVVLASSKEEALSTLEDFFTASKLGEAGKRVVIEECLKGEELSILALTDGRCVLPLASSQDHKRAFDNDEGPNTGGMGAYSPCPFVADEELVRYVELTVQPMIDGLRREGILYQGLIYAGLMLTPSGPRVLEYNVRFGDPETEAVLPRLKSDLLAVLLECAKGELKTARLDWETDHSVTVVVASEGYPGEFTKGFPITGLSEAEALGAIVFQAGTAEKGETLVNAGGRVLVVTALGPTLREAAAKAYQGIHKIRFPHSFFRKDIAKRIYERSVRV